MFFCTATTNSSLFSSDFRLFSSLFYDILSKLYVVKKRGDSSWIIKEVPFRQDWLCPSGCRRVRRPRKHLALSVSGGQIRRRYFSAGLYHSGRDLRLHHDRGGDRPGPHDQEEPRRRLSRPSAKGLRCRFGGWINADYSDPDRALLLASSAAGSSSIWWNISSGHGACPGRRTAIFPAFISNGVSAELCFLRLCGLLRWRSSSRACANGVERGVQDHDAAFWWCCRVIIAVYSVTRPGALEGVKYFLVPES